MIIIAICIACWAAFTAYIGIAAHDHHKRVTAWHEGYDDARASLPPEDAFALGYDTEEYRAYVEGYRCGRNVKLTDLLKQREAA